MFETMDHELRRKRRMALNPFFSKRSVQSLKPVIREKVDELLAKLRKTLNTNLVVDLSTAYAALTVDIVSEYVFGECTNIKRMVGGLHGWTYYILESRFILLPGNFPGSSTPCNPWQLALWPSRTL
jgi:cytochrome P450